MPPSLEEIRKILRDHRSELAHRFGVAEIGVFGSCVRGRATEESDIDILVSLDQPIGFFKFMELEETLTTWLGGPVDLVTKPALKPRIGKKILEETVMI